MEPADSPPPDGKSCAAQFGPVGMELTDETCTDGKYCEQLPDISMDLSELFETLDGSQSPQKLDAARQILELSYPFGKKILDRAGAGCLKQHADNPLTMGLSHTEATLGVGVHECGHSWDFDENKYMMAEGISYQWPAKDYFARAEVAGDRFSNDYPNAVANFTYLAPVGGGNQGLISTLEEWLQYNHNMAGMYVSAEYSPMLGGTDMMFSMNFAWIAPRYFLWARDNHPNAYEEMLADHDIREAILGLWGQTWLYYDANVRDTSFEPMALHTQYLDVIRRPEILEMMNVIRRAHGCSGIQ